MFRRCITKIVKYTQCSKIIKRQVGTSGPNKNPVRPGITLVFGKYLLATNTISSGILMLLGDLCQQEIEYHQHKLEYRYDLGRLSKAFYSYIYRFLD